MKVWKILVLIPYALILIFLLISASLTFSGGLGGILIGIIFLTFGIVATLLYTIILAIALVIRWIIHRTRKRQEPGKAPTA
ncbi:MAG TPA: hypothetical protein VJ249_08065 [Candidatus Bathyarchaeia archaeon]|nr:hypothetical protein [Candidatus Bathyarchaeia archaeon]